MREVGLGAFPLGISGLAERIRRQCQGHLTKNGRLSRSQRWRGMPPGCHLLCEGEETRPHTLPPLAMALPPLSLWLSSQSIAPTTHA